MQIVLEKEKTISVAGKWFGVDNIKVHFFIAEAETEAAAAAAELSSQKVIIQVLKKDKIIFEKITSIQNVEDMLGVYNYIPDKVTKDWFVDNGFTERS